MGSANIYVGDTPNDTLPKFDAGIDVRCPIDLLLGKEHSGNIYNGRNNAKGATPCPNTLYSGILPV